jgi:hypothetical protein
MFYYGYISKFSQNHDPGIINKYLDYAIENNFEIKKFFTETNFLNDEHFEQCKFNSLLNRIELQNTTIIINNCLDVANNLIELSRIYLLLSEKSIKIEIIENNSSSLLLDGLNRLGYSKPKSAKFSKISESINLKSSRGAVLNKIPIGYEKSINGKFKINENEKLIVRKIFDLYSGSYGNNKRLGLRKISEIIKKDFKNIKYKLGAQAIKNILKNRFYTGVYFRGSKIIFGNHEQIITTDEYNFIQEIFKSNLNSYGSKFNSNSNKKYLGLVCKFCNSKLNISYHSRKWILKNGAIQKNKYNYVYCTKNCKFKRKRIEMNQYIDEGYLKDNNLLLIKYKSKIKNLRANIKLLILGKLSLIYFKKEIEDFQRLENLLDLNNGSNIKIEDIKFKSKDKLLVKL